MKHLSVLLLAVFLLFSVIGFHIDVMSGGTMPYAIVIALAVVSGLNAVVWVLVSARLATYWLLPMIALQFFIGPINGVIARGLTRFLHVGPVAQESGLHFAGTSILVVVIVSYTFFTRYMGISGKEIFRIKNELDLAHSIQRTLVPEISKQLSGYEIFGVSRPSEKVGGDVVDVVPLRGGDTVAYLADIAGHGLQAGILMGMLKTSARTALAEPADGDCGSSDGSADGVVLSMLMARLNIVLPQVKEANMFATLTALRLNADGQCYYGMAGSPPLLHWRAGQQQMVRIEEQQFPLGILPVPHFPAQALVMEAGDVVLVATDGILEVNPHKSPDPESEYGIQSLEKLLEKHAARPLSELAATILREVGEFGRQADDQTLLIVRRSLA